MALKLIHCIVLIKIYYFITNYLSHLKMRHSIDDAFINQLFSHPSFQLRLRQAQKHQSYSRVEAPQIVELAEEIGALLAAEYKQRVE